MCIGVISKYFDAPLMRLMMLTDPPLKHFTPPSFIFPPSLALINDRSIIVYDMAFMSTFLAEQNVLYNKIIDGTNYDINNMILFLVMHDNTCRLKFR